MNTDEAVLRIATELAASGMADVAVRTFERMYRAYRGGESGLLPWEEIQPLEPGDLVPLAELEGAHGDGEGAPLAQVAWIVLNGGLGTSMKMERAKSLVPVRGSDTFLDLLARHVVSLRKRWNAPIPLLFMNSFATRDDTLSALARHGLCADGAGGPPPALDFVQHQFPRIREDDGLALGPLDERSSWAPAGHGDLYLALHVSGALRNLLDRGIRWAFVSNSDNLGASLHPAILGYLATHGLELLMEVTEKTQADVKGGTLVRRNGRLCLLELAQVPLEHQEDFQNVELFPVFNTNSLWLDLAAVERRLRGQPLDLPLIVNRKTVGDVKVVQLETAMGAAVGAFSRAAGIVVPRSRFAPVKTTNDLLVRRSDAYREGEESPLMPNPERETSLGPPLVQLDPVHYASVAALDLRVPHPLGLLRALTLEVVGDVRFGRGVTIEGTVRVENPGPAPVAIPDGAVLKG